MLLGWSRVRYKCTPACLPAYQFRVASSAYFHRSPALASCAAHLASRAVIAGAAAPLRSAALLSQAPAAAAASRRLGQACSCPLAMAGLLRPCHLSGPSCLPAYPKLLLAPTACCRLTCCCAVVSAADRSAPRQAGRSGVVPWPRQLCTLPAVHMPAVRTASCVCRISRLSKRAKGRLHTGGGYLAASCRTRFLYSSFRCGRHKNVTHNSKKQGSDRRLCTQATMMQSG